MPRYMKLSDYRRLAYADGSAPDPRTLRRRIDAGELPGKREGCGPKAHYYVLVDERTGLEARDLRHIRPVNRLAEKSAQQGDILICLHAEETKPAGIGLPISMS